MASPLRATTLRIIPLGGCGEVGKNMTAFEYGKNVILIDCGIMFPENDMLGIDFIIPDWKYLRDKRDQLRGIIVTHGHEDHTGGLPYLLKEFPDLPVFATKLTRGLIEVKLRNHKILDQTRLTTIEAGGRLELGPFGLEFFRVAHSIPDGVGVGITTPAGLVVHTGDFKFDHTPVDGKPTDFAKLAEFGGRGVMALMSDSTNADQPGTTPSERVVDVAFAQVFREAKGRILVGTFASLISRIQQVANAAVKNNRKLAFTGTSMLENVKMAQKLGYLDLPSDLIVRLEDTKKMAPERVVIMTTGTQGEPSSVLARVSMGQHSQIQVERGDTIIMSSHPIPGNEETVNRTINRLFQRGANVLYDPIAQVHVSGHASQEEQKLMLNLVKPNYFIPVHGELRHLRAHEALARQVGIAPNNIFVVENGYAVEFSEGEARVGERVPGGYIYIDGSGVGDVGPAVLRDREILGRDGFVVAVIHRDHETGRLVDQPELITKGFIHTDEGKDTLSGATDIIMRIAQDNTLSDKALRDRLDDKLSEYLYHETKRRPMIIPVLS
ncbi:MAG: ribonuclease J [Thermoflexales bacterium]|nr:ribonuclease J [Thermoflexales bacterium]